MKLLIILATALGISFSTGPQEVPTSLCHDPLLGPSMIIYSDCGDTPEVVDRDRSRRNNRSISQMIEQLADELDIQPVESRTEQVVDQPTEISLELSNMKPPEQITVLSIDQLDERTKVKKERCDKGSGNGAEGCDPGNHPEKGNNDEGGDKHPQNGGGQDCRGVGERRPTHHVASDWCAPCLTPLPSKYRLTPVSIRP